MRFVLCEDPLAHLVQSSLHAGAFVVRERVEQDGTRVGSNGVEWDGAE
jgi:hypothetical protein